MKRWLIGGAVLFGLAASSLTALGAALLRAPASDAGEIVFEVPSGASLSRVAAQLEASGLVRDARAFALLARVRGQASALRAGEYALSPSLGAGEILERLASGAVMTRRVVLPEGLRLTEIAARLEAAGLVSAQDFLRAVQDPGTPAALGLEAPSLEGFLFPETYEFARGVPPLEIARSMVDHFFEVWRPLEPAAAARGMSLHETVVLASLVEKETGAPEERPLVAAVFLNRLARGMNLATDPAVIYGIPEFDGNLRRIHLEDATNPYNTYLHPGLPPGPIASPGAAALRAVVEPADADYLYFVARNDGTHHFSKTYGEHVRAVNRYQRRGR